jgi:hypothetical protein
VLFEMGAPEELKKRIFNCSKLPSQRQVLIGSW